MYTDDYFRYYTPSVNDIYVDAGCCHGEFIKQYAEDIHRYTAHVLAIEPNPYAAESLLSELEDIQILDKITFIQKALSDQNGNASFSITNDDNTGALSRDFQYEAMPYVLHKKITVPTITLDSVINKYNVIDFLKMDIEGSEIPVLTSCSSLYEKISNLAIAAYHAYPTSFYLRYFSDIYIWLQSGRVTKKDVSPLLYAIRSGRLIPTSVYLLPFLKYKGYYTILSKQPSPILYASKTNITSVV